MSAVEQLGLQITETGARQTTANLDKFALSAIKADEAAAGLQKSVAAFGGGIRPAVSQTAAFQSTIAQVIRPIKGMSDEIVKNTNKLRLNRIGMMELQAAGVNSFQALASGMDPFHVAMMEGGQVVGAFVQGTVGGMKALKAALLGLLSPINLTFGALAAVTGYGIYKVIESNRHDIVGLTDDTSKLASATTAYATATKNVLMPLDQLTKKYGENASAAHKLFLVTQQLAKLKFDQSLGTLQDKLSKEFSGLQNIVSHINKLSSEPSSPAQKSRMGYQLTMLERQYHLTAESAKELDGAIKTLNAAKGPTQTSDALTKMADALSHAKDSAGNTPPKLLALALAASSAAQKGYALGSELTKADELAGSIADKDLGKGIRKAITDAQNLVSILSGVNGMVSSSRVALQEAKIRASAGPTAAGKIKAAGEIAGLRYDASTQPLLGKLPGGEAKMMQQVLAGRREEIVANARATEKLTLAQQAAQKALNKSISSSKKLTDQQKLENQILHQLGEGNKGYKAQIEALDSLLAHTKITQQQYNIVLGQTKEKMLEATPAGKAYAQMMGSFEQSFSSQIVKVHSFADAINVVRTSLANLAAQLASKYLQSFLFGTGPFSGGGTIASPGKSLLGGFISGLFGKLPGLATGSAFTDGGPTVVGENGPEVVDLPRGAQVHPYQRAKDMLAGLNQAAQVVKPEVNLKQINVLDPSIVGDYLDTHEGEQAVMNVVAKHKGDQ